MNIYSVLKSAGVCISCTPEAIGLGKSPFSQGASHNVKEMKGMNLMPEQAEEEKKTALQRPFEAHKTAAEVYFIVCRLTPFSFV